MNVYYSLAKYYEEIGEPEKAILQMEELARHAVEDMECRYRLVKYALERNELERAAKYLDELFFNQSRLEEPEQQCRARQPPGDGDSGPKELPLQAFWAGDDQRAAPATESGSCVEQPVRGAKMTEGVKGDLGDFQRCAEGHPVERLDGAVAFLEFLDLARQRGLGDVEHFRRAREAAVGRNRVEGA